MFNLFGSLVIKTVMEPSAIVRAHAMLSERLPFKSVHSLPYVVNEATLVIRQLDNELQAQLVSDDVLITVYLLSAE